VTTVIIGSGLRIVRTHKLILRAALVADENERLFQYAVIKYPTDKDAARSMMSQEQLKRAEQLAKDHGSLVIPYKDPAPAARLWLPSEAKRTNPWFTNPATNSQLSPKEFRTEYMQECFAYETVGCTPAHFADDRSYTHFVNRFKERLDDKVSRNAPGLCEDFE
jgi:hypothetical protein